MSFEPRDETSKRVFESAVRLVGERYRDVIETVYSIGIVDGQLKVINRMQDDYMRAVDKHEGESAP